jgi:hypothetical protein
LRPIDNIPLISARDIRAAHFERLLATKTEQDKPVLGEEDTKPTSTKAEETADDTSDASDSVAGGEDEGGLDEYAQDFLGEMDEEEKRVAKGDDVHCTLSDMPSVCLRSLFSLFTSLRTW